MNLPREIAPKPWYVCYLLLEHHEILHLVSLIAILDRTPASSRSFMASSGFVSNSLPLALHPHIGEDFTDYNSKDLLIEDSVSTRVPFLPLSFKLE